MKNIFLSNKCVTVYASMIFNCSIYGLYCKFLSKSISFFIDVFTASWAIGGSHPMTLAYETRDVTKRRYPSQDA